MTGLVRASELTLPDARQQQAILPCRKSFRYYKETLSAATPALHTPVMVREIRIYGPRENTHISIRLKCIYITYFDFRNPRRER